MDRSRRNHLRITYSNPQGRRTVELSKELEADVFKFLARRRLALADTARQYRKNRRGRGTFKCGVGYDYLDEDMLGGDGSGDTLSRFNKEMGWLL